MYTVTISQESFSVRRYFAFACRWQRLRCPCWPSNCDAKADIKRNRIWGSKICFSLLIITYYTVSHWWPMRSLRWKCIRTFASPWLQLLGVLNGKWTLIMLVTDSERRGFAPILRDRIVQITNRRLFGQLLQLLQVWTWTCRITWDGRRCTRRVTTAATRRRTSCCTTNLPGASSPTSLQVRTSQQCNIIKEWTITLMAQSHPT